MPDLGSSSSSLLSESIFIRGTMIFLLKFMLTLPTLLSYTDSTRSTSVVDASARVSSETPSKAVKLRRSIGISRVCVDGKRMLLFKSKASEINFSSGQLSPLNTASRFYWFRVTMLDS